MLHHQPGFTGFEHHVVDGDGVLVGELGRDAALVHDPIADRAGFRLVQACRRQHLFDGDVPVQQPIVCQPYRTHTATAQFRLQAVPAGHQIIGADDGTGAIDHAVRLVEFGGSWPVSGAATGDT